MIGYDTHKKYVLLKNYSALKIYDVVLFSDTKEELEKYCEDMGYKIYDSPATIMDGGYLIGLTEKLVDIKEKAIYKEYTDHMLLSRNNIVTNSSDKTEEEDNIQPHGAYIDITNNLRVGDEIVVSHSVYGEIPFIVIGKNHDGDNTITIMSKYILELLPFDAAEPSNIDEGRRESGNNNYKHSNLLQWLNSTDKDKWYRPQHDYDSAPKRCANNRKPVCTSNPYSNRDGFLCGFSEDFLSRLVTAPKRTVEPDRDFIGSSIIYTKVFLLSSTEIGLGTEDGVLEGETYEYFKIKNGDEYDRRRAYPSAYCLHHSDLTDLFIEEEGDGWPYWLRTPYHDSSRCTHVADIDGYCNGRSPSNGMIGVRPAMVLSHVHV